MYIIILWRLLLFFTFFFKKRLICPAKWIKLDKNRFLPSAFGNWCWDRTIYLTYSSIYHVTCKIFIKKITSRTVSECLVSRQKVHQVTFSTTTSLTHLSLFGQKKFTKIYLQ